jgi:ABC-2 type transport system ATP-binding protein
MELVGLKNAREKRVSDYSSGMRQRLAIARGLLADPPVLLLDEPTRCLDPVGAQDVRELISRDVHRGQGKTLLIATHNVAEANQLCGRVCVMDSGKLTADMAVEDARTSQGSLESFYRAVTVERQSVGVGLE